MPPRHGLRYTSAEKSFIRYRASVTPDKTSLYNDCAIYAAQMGRTEVAYCKQIELRNKWFWADK